MELAFQAAALRDATPPHAVHAGAGRHGAAALGPLGGSAAAAAASVGVHMSAAGPSQGANGSPSGGSAAAAAASVGAHQ